MKYKLLITHNKACDCLDVMLRADTPTYEGSVVKTIGRDNYTVGLGRDGSPVYIHMMDAENTDAIFDAVFARLKQGQQADQSYQNHIANVTHTLMVALALDHQKKAWFA